MPPEVQKRGRTIEDWFHKIVNFYKVRVSNGPTEALSNLIKRIKQIKRIGFGFRNFEHYRIRTLLYPGLLNWRVRAQSSSAKWARTRSDPKNQTSA
jgi:hypothetical protein